MTTTSNQMNQVVMQKYWWSGPSWPANVLLLISLVLLTSQTTEAGGKGKGRSGHIIVQNEVKGNPVPVYMPIPIPIPMPMGPSAQGPKFPPHHHHHPQQQHDDGEGEVKKIYLLQPISKPQPQPHMKGGAFMGPVQTHIHLPGSAMAAKHRQAGGSGHSSSRQHQQFRQQHDGDSGQYEQQHQADKHSTKQQGDVKVLPIVVIPPIAPMPPIQVQSNQPQAIRMTPQFNNYVLSASGETRRKMRHLAEQQHSGGRNSHSDSFTSYGGSVGGSIFRDNFASRSRPPRFRESRTRPMLAAASRSRDYDYSLDNSDYDGNNYSASPSRGDLYGRSARRYRNGGDLYGRRYSRESSGGRVNSIRDIVEQQQLQAQATQFDDDPVNELGAGLVVDDDMSTTASRLRQAGGASDFEIDSAELTPRGRQLIRQSSEISLDELASPQGADSLVRQARQQQQDLSSLYYERDPEPQTPSDYRRTSGGRMYSSGGSLLDQPSRSSRWRSAGRDERDLLDEDEWRFDSIKSVQHAALNETMTNNVNNATRPVATANQTTHS